MGSEGWSPSRSGLVVLVVLLVWGGGSASVAQEGGSSPPSPTASEFCKAATDHRSFDRRGLALMYCTTASGVRVPLHVAHGSARPAFYTAAPAAWMGAAVTRDRSVAAAAYRLTLSQGISYGLILGVKHTVKRSRPYVQLPLPARAERHMDPFEGDAFLSFPSGHAGLSAALSTSWSLSYPRWYVIGPAALWASAVALSRVHLGVHFPSDVLIGSALGVGVAVLVHQLRTLLTPQRLETKSNHRSTPAMPVSIQIQF